MTPPPQLQTRKRGSHRSDSTPAISLPQLNKMSLLTPAKLAMATSKSTSSRWSLPDVVPSSTSIVQQQQKQQQQQQQQHQYHNTRSATITTSKPVLWALSPNGVSPIITLPTQGRHWSRSDSIRAKLPAAPPVSAVEKRPQEIPKKAATSVQVVPPKVATVYTPMVFPSTLSLASTTSRSSLDADDLAEIRTPIRKASSSIISSTTIPKSQTNPTTYPSIADDNDDEFISISCPTDLDNPNVHEETIPTSVARLSGTLAHMLKAAASFSEGLLGVYHFPTITSTSMRPIMDYLYDIHYQSKWGSSTSGTSLFQPNLETVLDLIWDASFMDIPGLVEQCVNMVVHNFDGISKNF